MPHRAQQRLARGEAGVRVLLRPAVCTISNELRPSSDDEVYRCLTDARLSKLAENMTTSFVYSHDVVSRLSLGSIRDMNRAAAWLCQAQVSTMNPFLNFFVRHCEDAIG